MYHHIYEFKKNNLRKHNTNSFWRKALSSGLMQQQKKQGLFTTAHMSKSCWYSAECLISLFERTVHWVQLKCKGEYKKVESWVSE